MHTSWFKKFYLLFFCVLLCLGASAKSKPSLKLADKYYHKREYEKAAKEYKRLERGRHTDNYIFLQLADCYNRLSRDIEASKYYGKAIYKDPTVDSEIYYKYAQVLQKTGRYEVARDMMDDYAVLEPNNPRTRDYLINPDAYYDLYKIKERYMFSEIGFNDRQYQDFGAFLTPSDTLYFVSNRTKHEKKIPRKLFEVRTPLKREPNFDLYMAQYKQANEPIFITTRLRGKINKRFNDGPMVSGVIDKTFIFTSESYRHRRYRKIPQVKKRDGIQNLFTATLKKNKYRKIKKLPFTKGKYTYQNPAISPDSTYLYFASNMPGGYGELDIWRVAILEEGLDYGEPENLGPLVNTGTKNDFPFISSNNILYFASDRWGGYGGLDVYSYDLDQPSKAAVNLGAPLNTPRDDYNFTYYPDKHIGFISTNRIGRTDIYKVQEICQIPVEVIVKDKSNGFVIKGAKVQFINPVRLPLDALYTNNSGKTSTDLKCLSQYALEVSHEDFLTEKQSVTLKRDQSTQQIVVELVALQSLVVNDSHIELADINFAFDQDQITPESKIELDKLVKVMNRYPSMTIRVDAHTDSKGDPEYNLKLSEQRAKATVEYLIDQGIESSRLEYKGYGSTQLKVDCKECSELENAINRRSEFIILKL